MVRGLRVQFRVQSLGVDKSGSGIRIQRGIRVLGFLASEIGIRVSSFRISDPGIGFRFCFWVSGSGLGDSGSEFGI